MRKHIVALLVGLLVILGVAIAVPAMAAGGYVLNDSARSVIVVSNTGVRAQVAPGQSSALFMLDANSVLVARGYCMWLDGRLQAGVGPRYIPIADGTVRRVTRYQLC